MPRTCQKLQKTGKNFAAGWRPNGPRRRLQLIDLEWFHAGRGPAGRLGRCKKLGFFGLATGLSPARRVSGLRNYKSIII